MPTKEQVVPLRDVTATAHSLQVVGRWPEAIEVLRRPIEIHGSDVMSALLERGLNQRMVQDYQAAEKDFTAALALATTNDNVDGQVDALVGLMDIARTGDRDPRYGIRIEQARAYNVMALKIVEGIEGWRMSKVNYYVNAALLSQAQDYYHDALEDITTAEIGCDVLLYSKPNDMYLLNRRARTFTIKGVTLEKLGRMDEALRYQSRAYMEYAYLDDMRGMGNAAMSTGGIYERKGNVVKAREWYELARTAAMSGDEILDRTIYDAAQEKLAALSDQSTASL